VIAEHSISGLVEKLNYLLDWQLPISNDNN
jgi:hypothetical protein